jgi:hypothetical protein
MIRTIKSAIPELIRAAGKAFRIWNGFLEIMQEENFLLSLSILSSLFLKTAKNS